MTGVNSEVPRAPRPPLTFLNVAEMVAISPPQVPFVAEPILVRGYVTMLAGREGTGKSLLALGLAAAAGNGRAVGGIEFSAPATILYVDAENGEGEIHRRLHALGVVPVGLEYAMANGFDLKKHFALLVAEVKRVAPTFVVLDSLRSLAPTYDENDSASAEAVIAPLRWLAREHNCAVLVLHHAGKGESSREYRGSSGLGAAVDCGFTLGRDAQDPEKRTRRWLACFKMRPAPEPPVQWLALNVDDGRLTLAEAEPFEDSGGGERVTEESRLGDEIVAYLGKHGPQEWGTVCTQALGVKADHGTAKRARKAAIDDGRIVRLSRGRYALKDSGSDRPAGQDPKAADRPDGREEAVRPLWPDDRTVAAAQGYEAPASGVPGHLPMTGAEWS